MHDIDKDDLKGGIWLPYKTMFPVYNINARICPRIKAEREKAKRLIETRCASGLTVIIFKIKVEKTYQYRFFFKVTRKKAKNQLVIYERVGYLLTADETRDTIDSLKLALTIWFLKSNKKNKPLLRKDEDGLLQIEQIALYAAKQSVAPLYRALRKQVNLNPDQ